MKFESRIESEFESPKEKTYKELYDHAVKEFGEEKLNNMLPEYVFVKSIPPIGSRKDKVKYILGKDEDIEEIKKHDLQRIFSGETTITNIPIPTMKTPEQTGETAPEKKEGIKYTRNDNNLEKMLFESEEKLLEEYKNNKKFKKTISELENIVKNAGFEGLSINKEGKSIGAAGYTMYSLEDRFNEESTPEIGVYENPKDKVQFSENLLKNIRELFMVDKKLAREEIISIITHEKNHLLGPAGKLMEKENKEMEKEMANLKINDPQIIAEKVKEIHKKYYPQEENQAELQRINEYYKNLDDLIEKEAQGVLALCVIYHGFDYLKKISFGPANGELNYKDFIDKKIYREESQEILNRIFKILRIKSNENNKPIYIHDPVNKKVDKKYTEVEIHKKIIEHAEKMRKELLKKYEKYKGGSREGKIILSLPN